VAGTGIQLVASGINKNLTINNTQSITTATGSGITATTVGGATALVANLTAGNGITITPSVANTSKMITNSGLLGLTATNAGTNITITGTSTVPIINASGVLGVASVSAGTNVSITGTSTNPIINANVALLRDVAGAFTYTLSASQLKNSTIFSSVAYASPSAAITINLPSYASMLSAYGANALVPFFLGDLNYNLTDLYLSSTEDQTKIFITNSLQGNTITTLQNLSASQLSALPSGQYSVPNLQTFQCVAYVNSARGTVNYNLNWFGYYN
jgi:hypothetical protein